MHYLCGCNFVVLLPLVGCYTYRYIPIPTTLNSYRFGGKRNLCAGELTTFMLSHRKFIFEGHLYYILFSCGYWLRAIIHPLGYLHPLNGALCYRNYMLCCCCCWLYKLKHNFILNATNGNRNCNEWSMQRHHGRHHYQGATEATSKVQLQTMWIVNQTQQRHQVE